MTQTAAVTSQIRANEGLRDGRAVRLARFRWQACSLSVMWGTQEMRACIYRLPLGGNIVHGSRYKI
jgi:hypothetical protein